MRRIIFQATDKDVMGLCRAQAHCSEMCLQLPAPTTASIALMIWRRRASGTSMGMVACPDVFSVQALANDSLLRDDFTDMANRRINIIRHRCAHARSGRILLALICALALALSGSLQAYAANPMTDEIDAAQQKYESAEAALQAAEEKLASISAEYGELSDEVDALQTEIDALASQVLEAQSSMLEGRSALANTAVYEYRSSSLSNLLSSILGARSWNELSRNVDYVEKIMDQQTAEIAQQRELKDQFMQASNKLTAQKNEQDAKLEVLNSKRTEAAAVVEEAAQYADESSEKLADLRQQAEQFIWKSQAAEEAPEEDPEANTTEREDVVSDNTPVIPDPTPTQPSGEYRTGVASAYGGSSDPYTPNPGRTATGAICDDFSMGVAIPMSMPNFRSYYGRTVEIVYNGMTVYATVNDCGSMGGGSRALDLQPGVFKAFGYGDCYAWGVRTVTYRFL